MSVVDFAQGFRVAVLLLSILVLWSCVVKKDLRRTLTMVLVMIGGCLNWFVVHANGGMPVLGIPTAYLGGEHIRLTAATKYAWLADVHGKVDWAMFSVGDMFLGASLLIMWGWALYEHLHSRWRSIQSARV